MKKLKTDWNQNKSMKKFDVVGGMNSKKNNGRIAKGNVLYLHKFEAVILRKNGYKLEEYKYCGKIDNNYTLDKLLNTYNINLGDL